MALKQLTAPTQACITLLQAKAHLRVDVADDDDLITTLIDAATQDAEHLMQRAVMPQQWVLTLDAWAPTVQIQRPITAVLSVKYLQASTGEQITLPDTDYLLDLSSDLVARLTPLYGQPWPTARAQLNAVEITFACGYADASAVPSLIKQWVLLRIAALYENRESWTLHRKIEPNEFIDRMLDRYRVFTL